MQTRDIEIIIDEDESEYPALIVKIKTPDGNLDLLGEVESHDNHIVVRRVHIQGTAKEQWAGRKSGKSVDWRRRNWMSNTSKFTERFGPRVQTRAVSRVKSGSTIRLSLSFEPGANTPEAARILVRRHLSVRAAHAALTEMVDNGKSYVTVPCVENLKTLKRELKKVGVIAREHEPRHVDVRAVRRRTKLTQEKFAIRYGLDLATLKNWEQGRSKPDAAANTLLMTIHSNPQAVENSLEVDEKAAAKAPYTFNQRAHLTIE